MQQQEIRVCYETSGIISGKWLREIISIVKKSGGTIKMDLKAHTPEIYKALTGVSNDIVLRNFRMLAKEINSSPFLIASILLVPGYIGVQEVQRITQFIADCNPDIPTALLGFYPHHAMRDLPRTSRVHAEAAKEIAKESGLTNVRIGNLALLSDSDYNFE
jgi:pyruvate formate lyase activating enzyme